MVPVNQYLGAFVAKYVGVTVGSCKGPSTTRAIRIVPGKLFSDVVERVPMSVIIPVYALD